MPRKQTRILVRVEDLGGKEGLRKLIIEVEGDQTQFETSDFCAREGVVLDLEGLLKALIKDGIVKYIASGGEILRSIRPRIQASETKETIVNRTSVSSGVEH